MKVKEKLSCLQLLKNDIGDEAFRTTVARIYSEFYIRRVEYEGKEVRKIDVLRYVNEILVDNGVKPLSYSYFKKNIKLKPKRPTVE